MSEESTEVELVGDENDRYLEDVKVFHLEMPLYNWIDIKEDHVRKAAYAHMSYTGTVDAYCIFCQKESVFECEEPGTYDSPIAWSGNKGFERVVFSCTRQESHKYYTYYYHINKSAIVKIGQLPSVADLLVPQATKYRKLLGNEKYTEFTKGIGLAAHGVGIGSFVYLRRILEHLIEQAHKTLSGEDFDEDAYVKAKMDEKIKMLETSLPTFLVENRSIYKVLSKGIHELGEDECLAYFDAMHIGIEEILNERLEKEKQLERKSIAQKAVQKATLLASGGGKKRSGDEGTAQE